MASLNQIKIELEGIGHFLNIKKLSVPPYQRSYAWEEKHINDLFQDISTAIHNGEEEYFLGSIVVKTNKNDRAEVVDGQQRLATITILLSAIRNYFQDNGDTKRAWKITNDYLLSTDLRTEEDNPHLCLNEADNDFYFQNILKEDLAKKTTINLIKDSHIRLQKASELAEKQVEKIVKQTTQPSQILLDWIDFIKSGVRVIWVEVPDYSNAFTIFETLNDRGLDLAISDLLKNYLFHISDNRIEEAKNNWVSMVAVLEAVSNESIVVPYIRYLWTSYNGNVREKELYDHIKKKITNKQTAIDFSRELSKSAHLYVAILHSDHEHWNSFGSSTRNHVETINLLGMVQIRPLLLAILENFDREEIKKSLRNFVSIIVRFLISGTLSSGIFETQFSQTAMKVRKGIIKNNKQLLSDLKSIIPGNAKFKEAFSLAKVSISKLAKYYLRALENQTKGDPEPELIPSSDEEIVNLEHILPQSPSKKWNRITNEEAKLYCKRIGNLTLLKNKVNTKAGNDVFQDKVKEYKKSNFIITSSLSKYITWGPKEINKRQDELAELAIKAWPVKT